MKRYYVSNYNKKYTRYHAIHRNKSVMITLVSVIIPIYNVEKYLEQCFASIISQTYKNIEIILIDDGSTDNSGDIADRLAQDDSRVRIIHKKNGGLSDARNAGMKIATGEYITFIDSDDYVDAKFIEILLELAQTTGAEIIQCNNSRKSTKLGMGSSKAVMMQGTHAFIELMKYKTVSPTAWAKLYKRSLFYDNKLEFPVGRLHEDTAIVYKLIYLADKIVCNDNVLYFYRLNNMSIMTANYTKHHYGSVLKYHKELDAFIVKNKVVINKRLIYRHKALRFLSVLNKMALHKAEHTDDYNKIKLEYIKLSVKSYSATCVLGMVSAYVPVIFRTIRKATPLIRNILGKT